MARPYLSLWLIPVAMFLAMACSSSPSEKSSVPTMMPAPAAATQPVQTTPVSSAKLGKVAFVKGGDVWVKDLPDGEAKRLTQDGHNSEPRWSPSGQWLTSVKDAGAGGAQLWILRVASGESRVVGAVSRTPAFWSPVSDRFAYVTEAGIAIEDADGSNHREIPTRVQGEPAWSPDGSWLAFARTDVPDTPGDRLPGDRRGSIWRVRADGTDLRLVLDGGDPAKGGFQGGFLVAGWSPDGAYLLYWTDPMFSASGLADGSSLLSVPVGGGEPREVANRMLLHRDFLSWSPSGKELALVDGSYRSTWYRKQLAVSLFPASAWDLSEPSTADLFPAWSPNGRTIAYTSAPAVQTDGGNDAKQASWQRRLWVMQSNGSGKHQVTKDPSYRDERPRWSADGAFILFGRMIDDRMQLWLMRPDGSDQKQAADEMSPLPDRQAGWFGYYGYLDWGKMYDWWQQKPAKPAAPSAASTPSAWDRSIDFLPPEVISTSLEDEDRVWAEVARSARDVSPILRPRFPPAGLDIVLVRDVTERQGSFRVEYRGPGNKQISISVGALNPPYWPEGEQRTVTVRGQQAVLQVKSKTQPSELVELYWNEPGRWVAAPGAPTKDSTFYLVSAYGFDPEVVLKAVNSLEEMKEPGGRHIE